MNYNTPQLSGQEMKKIILAISKWVFGGMREGVRVAVDYSGIRASNLPD